MNIEHEILYCSLQAQWWIAAATNGHCLSRELYHGSDGPAFTDAEKIADAMEIAQTHLRRICLWVDAEGKEL